MFSSILPAALALGCALGVSGQTTSPYTDPVTGITFQQYLDESSYSFGIALPENPEADFIGQVVTPLTDSAGWGGISFGGQMTGTLLLVTWADGEQVQGSLREATGYASPEVYSGDASLSPICDGNSVNETHATYTFLCTGCILGAPMTFAAEDATFVLGWARSTEAVADPADPATGLEFHDGGFGMFSAKLEAARSADFATWAELAGDSCGGGDTPPPSNSTIALTSPSNNTVPLTPRSNGTATIPSMGLRRRRSLYNGPPVH